MTAHLKRYATARRRGRRHDRRDKAAQRFAGLLDFDGITRQRLRQVGDAATIALGEIGHQRDRRFGVQVRQLAAIALALTDQRGHHLADLVELLAAIGDGERQALHPAVGLCHPLFECPSRFQIMLAVGDQALLILLDIRRHRFGLEHALAQRAKHAALEDVVGDATVVAAGPGLLMRAAAPAVASDDGVAAIAGAAPHEAAQQAFGPLLSLGAQPYGVAEPRDRLLPGLLVDDGQCRDRGRYPLRAGVGAGDALPGRGVADEALPVVADDAGIKLVVEDAVTALAVAVDGVRAPFLARGGGHAFLIERLGDGAGAATGKILPEDTLDDGCLCLVDLAQAALGLAVGPKPRHPAIAIAEATGDAAPGDPADLTAAGLLAQLFQEQRSHRALEADMQFRHFAFRQRDDMRAREPQPLVDSGDVLLVAAQPVEGFCNDDIELADPLEQRVETRPVARRARDGEVGEHVDQRPAFCVDTRPAQPRLVLS